MKEKKSKAEAEYKSISPYPSERCGVCHGLLPKDSDKEKPIIYFARHGATKLNSESGTSVDIIRAWMNVELSPEGEKEISRLAAQFERGDIQRVYSSDLKRAADTALGLADKTGAELYLTRSLRPWDLGKFAGQPTKESLPKIARYVRDEPGKDVPGGESFDSFKLRAFSGIEKIISEQPAGIVVALVGHHRIERLWKAWLAAGAPSSGDICLDTFLQKGECPGHIEAIEFPMDACRKVKGRVDRRAYCELFVRRRDSDPAVQVGGSDTWAL